MPATSSAPSTVSRWLTAHRSFGDTLRRRMQVAETGETPEPRTVDERLLQCIWFDQLLRAGALATASGKRVEILDPGQWNRCAGPDFLGARLTLAGEELAGDVEIHIASSGWRAHGHHQDFEYNNVVLHVCLNVSDDRPYEEKQNGERLERVSIAGAIEPDLETLRRTINVADYPHGRPAHVGHCHEQFIGLAEKDRRAFFDAAGRARMEDKIARFAAQLASASLAQLVYQSIMTGQGYKANKTLYFLLSKRAPYNELLDYAGDVAPGERVDLFLAILLNVARLVPPQFALAVAADEETAAFAARLDQLWRPVRGYFSDRFMPPTKRWHAGMRPPGFPGRRLTAVAFLLGRIADADNPLMPILARRLEGLPVNELDAKGWKTFFRDATTMLTVEGDGHYFTRHYTLGGKPCRPQALLGEPAARTLLFNVMLPLMVLHGRTEKNRALEHAAWAAIERFPALPRNSITDMMKRRLFGDTDLDKSMFRTELMNQALIKVFQGCCASDERTCAQCTFLNAPYEPAP